MGGKGRDKLLGVRQAQECIVQLGEYNQYFEITVNHNKFYKTLKKKKLRLL